jgi:RNA polymerase sigma factor (sigma-70 family)
VALNEREKPYRRATPFSGLPSEQQQRLAHLPVDRPGAEETVALREQVRAALQALNAEQRLCVILREYEGLSHREIGAVLGCSEGNARVLVHRARRALRAHLLPLLESEESCV